MTADLLMFLERFRPDGCITFVGIVPDGSTVAATFNGADPRKTASWLMSQNRARNVYFTVNPTLPGTRRKPTKDDITAIAAMWGDVDPLDGSGRSWDVERERLMALADELQKLPTPPSLTIDSGNGIQPIWLLADPIEASPEYRHTAEALCARFERALGAKGTHNCDRLLRVPGTINFPNAKKRKLGRGKTQARLLHENWAGYSWRDLEALAAHFEHRPPASAIPIAPDPDRRSKGADGAGKLALPTTPPDPLEPDRLTALRDNHPEVFDLARFDQDESRRDMALARVACRLGWPPVDAWALIIAVRDDAKRFRRDYIERTLRRAYTSSGAVAETFEIGTRLDRTDLANARRLVGIATGKIIWAPGIGWLGWTGTHWRESDTEALKLAARVSRIVLDEVAETTRCGALELSEEKRKSLTLKAEQLLGWATRSENRDRIAAALSLSRPYLEIEPAKLDTDPWLFNLRNGTLDLRTGKLREHRPSDHITKLAPVSYDPNASAPTWQAFLQRILPSAELRAYVKRAAGYCLTGRVDEQVLFFAWGIGANGKSTFMACLRSVMGPYAVRPPSDLLIASKSERHSTEIMTLRGARLAICQEVEKGRQWAAQRLKELTGEEEVTARRLYRDYGTFRLTAKLFVVGNHKPNVGDRSEAFWRRMRLIPFDVTIPADERDPRLLDKLKAEASGILNWVLEGARDWQEHGLGMPPEIAEAVKKYRKETDNIRGFIDECCVRDERERIKPGELFAAYQGWCKSANEPAAGPAEFKTALVDQGFHRVTVHGQAHWKGIALKSGGWVVGGAETLIPTKVPT